MTAPRMSIPQDLMTEVFKELVRLDADQEVLTKLRDEMAAQATQINSNCNEVLRRQGKAYPRTCALCGFGKCRL